MDENVEVPPSSCETPCHALNSSESKPEMCEQTEYQAISSTSASENIPAMNLESMPIIKLEEGVEGKIQLRSTERNVLYVLKRSIEFSLLKLVEEQVKCNDHVVQIKKEIEMLSDSENPVHEIQSLAVSEELLNFEKNANNHLSSIKEALMSIKDHINTTSSVARGIRQGLKLLNKSMEKTARKQLKHKVDLIGVKELAQKFFLPATADNEILRDIRYLINFTELSIAELSAQALTINSINELFKSIMEELPPSPSKNYPS